MIRITDRPDMTSAFYAPNFEKVGDILISACLCVCVRVQCVCVCVCVCVFMVKISS